MLKCYQAKIINNLDKTKILCGKLADNRIGKTLQTYYTDRLLNPLSALSAWEKYNDP